MAEALFQGVFDRVHRIIIVIAKRLPAHFAPDQFLGVALRAVSWQPVQGQVIGHGQCLGLMPARPIQEHQNMFVGMPPGHFRQIERHGHRVRVRQDQADEFAILRADAAKNMGVLAHPMGGYLRTAAGGSPAPNRIAQRATSGAVAIARSHGEPPMNAGQARHRRDVGRTSRPRCRSYAFFCRERMEFADWSIKTPRRGRRWLNRAFRAWMVIADSKHE